MRTVLRGGRAAIVFLTRVPVGGFPYSRDEWRWSSAWFPFVGLLIGILSSGVWMLVASAGPFVAAMSALTFSILVTGAFHEDGLADTADALGGAYDREALFRILKDSRVGAFGALALVIAVGFRLVLLARVGSGLGAASAPAALVLMHTVARAGPIWLMVATPYVTAHAEAKSRLVTRASLPQGLMASGIAFSVLVMCIALGVVDMVAVAAVCLAVVGVNVVAGWRFRVRAGGVTGDFLGAAEQLGEVAVLMALVLVT